MKRIIALALSLVMALSFCVSPAWGADDATEQAAQGFVDAYLSNDEGDIYGHVKGFDGSLSKMFESEGAWNELSAEAQSCVNELLDAAQSGLSYEKLLEWTQGFMFMVNYLVIAEGDYEGYIISTDPNGGTLVDPDPPQNTYAIEPFTHEIWQRIVNAEEAYNALSDEAKAYLEKLMTEKGFGLNNGIEPADLPVCDFEELLAAAKENLENASVEQAAQDFVDTYLSNDEGDIFGHVKGFDGSLGKMFESEGAWNELSEEAQSRVNELLDAAQTGLSYEKLLEWTQGFMFMVEYLVIAEGDYEGYVISTDPNGGTLVDPDPPQNTYAVEPFTHEIWQRIVGTEDAYNALSADAKAYLKKLMTESGFGLNNGIQPAGLPVCDFEELSAAAKENLTAYEAIGSKLEDAGIDPVGVDQMTAVMVQAIAEGAEIEVEVDTQVVSKETVGNDKQTKFEEELKDTGYEVDRYLEIEVLMTVDGYDPVVTSRTVEPIWIDLGEAKWGYDYAVLREHEGELVLLSGDEYVKVNLAERRVYVSSDCFSLYAVVAKPKTTSGNVGANVPVTGENEPVVTSANTVDAGLALSVAAAILSVTGMAWAGKKRD